MNSSNRDERLGLAQELRQRGESARRRDGLMAVKCYEEAVSMLREVGEPRVLAHTIRHLGDVYFERGRPDLAEPCYREALEIYRAQGDGSSLDLANAMRSFAVLRWEQTKEMWQRAGELYANLAVEAGVKESTARVRALSIR